MRYIAMVSRRVCALEDTELILWSQLRTSYRQLDDFEQQVDVLQAEVARLRAQLPKIPPSDVINTMTDDLRLALRLKLSSK